MQGIGHVQAAAWTSPFGPISNDRGSIFVRRLDLSLEPKQMPESAAIDWCDPVAPPADTLVVVERRQGIAAEQIAELREAALNKDHREEVASLTASLRHADTTHSAEIRRLHAEHAAEMLKLVGELWTAQDTVRTLTQATLRTVLTKVLLSSAFWLKRCGQRMLIRRGGHPFP